MYPPVSTDYQKYPSAPPSASAPPPPPYSQTAANGFTVSSGNNNAPRPLTPRPWSTGLCVCGSDTYNECITCWCPCITFGQIAEIVDKGNTSCASAGALYALLSLVALSGCLYSGCYRSKLRGQYLLPETPCNDCLVHFCCENCALRQEFRELQHQGFDLSIGWEGNVNKRNRAVEMAPVVDGGMYR